MTTRNLKCGVGGVVFALAACCLLGRAQQQTPAPAATGQGAQQEKLVDEARKNIQVLKGLPDSRLLPVMQLVASSLGVQCGFCHVREGNEWQFDRDDKQEKKTARKMIQMVIDINKASFNGRTDVTCYSCHRGHEQPVAMIPLPVQPPRPEAPAAKPGEAAPKPPTPAEVVDKYLQAIGGKAAADKLTSRVMKGSYIAFGRTMPLEVYQKGADKMLAIIENPQQGTTHQGLDGETGWIKTRAEQRDMNSVELARIKSVATFYDAIKVNQPPSKIAPAGKAKIGDQEVIVLRMPLSPDRSQRMYFDTQTGLLLRVVVLTQTPIGRVPEQYDFEDYRDVDGVKMPFTIQYATVDGRAAATRKFTEIKHNVAIDDEKFKKPAAQ